jgi:hypothetical protein
MTAFYCYNTSSLSTGVEQLVIECIVKALPYVKPPIPNPQLTLYIEIL